MSVDGPIAVVLDQTGRQLQVRRDFLRAKGYLPQPGEQWLIDKALNNTWTFALCLSASNSVDTDVQALQKFQDDTDNAICILTLVSPQSIISDTDTFATIGWQVESDALGMATLSTSGGTQSFVTTAREGLYRLSLHATIGSVSGAAMAAFITYQTPSGAASIARDNRVSVPAGSDGTWVNPDREVYLGAGVKLYWGFWCSATSTLNTSALNQPTELEVRCSVPAPS
jgi:hypothetical protein